VFPESLRNLEEKAADFASELGLLLAVVAVEIFVWGIANGTDNLLWNHRGVAPAFDHRQRFAMCGFIAG
jgi:hypothetical protein